LAGDYGILVPPTISVDTGLPKCYGPFQQPAPALAKAAVRAGNRKGTKQMTMLNPDRRSSNAPESEALGSDDVAIFENARQAVMSLKKTLDMWVVIGRGVVRARDIADRRGGRWAFQRLLDQQGLAPALGRNWASQKATANKLINIMANLGEVMVWHEELSPAQQILWAAPTTIYKHCPVFKKGDGDADAEKPPSKLKQVEQSLAKALQENHHLAEQLKRKDDGSLFDLKNDTIYKIDEAIVANVTPNKASAIAKGLLARLKRKPAPAG
jgi:hypothetical protein